MAGNQSKTGREAGFYLSFTEDFQAPIFFHAPFIKDLNLSSTVEEKEDDCRNEDGDKDTRYLPGKRTKEISTETCHRPNDPLWVQLAQFYNDCKPVDILKLNCKIDEDGARGTRFNAMITQGDCNQPLNDPLSEAYTFKPSGCTDDPCQEVYIDVAGDLVDRDGNILVDLP
jgi:hypothetical protein